MVLESSLFGGPLWQKMKKGYKDLHSITFFILPGKDKPYIWKTLLLLQKEEAKELEENCLNKFLQKQKKEN